MYAVVDFGGKQHKVSKGDFINFDRMDLEPGAKVEFDKVLYASDDKDVKVGTPVLEKAKVLGEVVGEVKAKKVIAFFYRRRKDSQRKVGHRQKYTRVKITDIKC